MMLAVLAACLINMSSSLPDLPREFRGVWVATVDNIDWPSARNLTTAKQKSELLRILDLAKRFRLNAVILQVRPHADALYDSPYEPWSEYLTGKQGRAPSPFWDPLGFAVAEAHKRGLELHAWINPYRAWHPAAKGQPATTSLLRTNPASITPYGKFQWMRPSDPFVQDWSLKVILDLVERYDIDGLHMDDYFYPYPVRSSDSQIIDFPDASEYQQYRLTGGTLSKSDWRRQQVNSFVERMYKQIKAIRPWVKVGISPFGIYRPGVPSGIRAGIDQYANLYADPVKWLKEGWCDYMAPQLYWPIDQKAQSYKTLLTWWESQNDRSRHLWPGNFTSQLSPTLGNWEVKEIIDQIKFTRRSPIASGNIHYSMKPFLQDTKGVGEFLAAGPYKERVLVPPSPWLNGDEKIEAPKIMVQRASDALSVSVLESPEQTRFLALVRKERDRWVIDQVHSREVQSLTVPDQQNQAIIAISRTGQSSLPVYIRP